MLTMHYQITLPADYDMGVIRRRIAERGHLTDDLPQLAFKAYLYADRNQAYAAGREHRYAPFYLWRDTHGMNAFLGGTGFAAVVASFGRPPVHACSVWDTHVAPDLSIATHATCETLSIPRHTPLQATREAEQASAAADRDRGALASIGSFDPSRWTMTRFRLWRDAVMLSSADADTYQVGHVSQPSASR
ncbi:MAG TPA: DUF4865 family protein [Dyella sp.]|uniref:DUF4865 family protein n=1 Tax=Dyella sp. TaxID=1869338 RepID=UPI002B91088B|nr:DUF4865 family protein [Dyella sp.]HUB91502.1 DUF4865 family protein [Dyella sp.]